MDELRDGEIHYDSSPIETVQFGSVAVHICDSGHMLVGNETRKCTGDGSSIQGYFDGVEPVCEGIYTYISLCYESQVGW